MNRKILPLTSNSERRKRIKIPTSILLIGILLILMPFLSFFLLYLRKGNAFHHILSGIQWYQLLLILLPLPIGIGLLRVRKLAWYALLVYGSILIVWNVYTAIFYPSHWNSFALAESTLFFILIVYFLRKDISSPYFKLYPRGWRGEKRHPIQASVRINSQEFATRDFSLAGFYCDHASNESFQIGDEVALKIADLPDDFKGGIVRIDPNGFGVAFRNLNDIKIQKLNEFINLLMEGTEHDSPK
jgi:hypothetical protein